MSRFTAAQRHQATHELDEMSIELARVLQKMINPAYAIGVDEQLRSIQQAVQTFHDRVAEEHTVALREMRN